MTTTPTNAAEPEASDIDTSARCPLLILIGSAIAWLVVGGVLTLIASIQLHTPEFLAHCPFLTYGRMQAAQETAFLYGWAINAGLAVSLWLLARLGGVPLRATGLAAVGAIFWNLALTVGLAGILAGDLTGFSFFQLPAYVQPFMFVAYAAVAVAGVLAWTGRRNAFTFATQWYAVAPLFVFPWVFSVAQVTLLFAPVHGTIQAVVGAWFGQNLGALVLAPFALAAAYYLVPKISGRPIHHYDYAAHGFWALLVIGGWAGGRQLIGGPVPVWVATTGIIASVLLLFHYVVVGVNLSGALCPRGSLALRFTAIGLKAYVLGGVLNAVTSIRAVAKFSQFTFFSVAQTQLLLGGAFTFMIFGAIYFLVPRLAGKPWPSSALIRLHFAAVLSGLVLKVGGLFVAGWIQGGDLNHAAVSFPAIAGHVRMWLIAATAGQALTLLGSLALALNFSRLLVVCFKQPAKELLCGSVAVEVPVS
ncbi:MAG TPA: cbb3-type cytochrome c oxidase subunit I [Opitutaceae bacterium]|jgi:cytochrome c oxidase cbb3-type subunit 1|nr:cbb3-type cytochrome c oxidase subunit I [Opitutaceae bacterium]